MIKLTPNSWLYLQLQQMAMTPKKQIKKLAIGSLISILAMLAMVLTSELENRILFYSLTAVLMAAVAYAVPGYIGVWVWRMQKVLFKHNND